MSNPFNLTELINTLSIQSYSYDSGRMEKYIFNQLDKLDVEVTVDNYGNIYAVKGDAELYPTMVSHIDTVHKVNTDVIVRRHNDTLYAIDTTNYHRYGIGGDDKVGVYITLACLKSLPVFKAVFFKDEEVGCIGSSHADFSFFDNSTIVLECDRKGMGDFVTDISFTELANDDLLNDINNVLKTYGRKSTTGGLTDVLNISENNEVQCANVNCGYYQPHTENEYVSISDVEATLLFCLDVFNTTQHKRYSMDLASRSLYDPYEYSQSYNSYTPKKSENKTYDFPLEIMVDGILYMDYGDSKWAFNESTNDFYEVDDEEYYAATDRAFVDTNTLPEQTKHVDCNMCDSNDTMYDAIADSHFCFGCNDYINTQKTISA